MVGEAAKPEELWQHHTADPPPGRRAQLRHAGLAGAADALAVVFDQDVQGEPVHQRPIVLVRYPPVHRAFREAVPADYCLICVKVTGAPVRAKADDGCTVPAPAASFSTVPGVGT